MRHENPELVFGIVAPLGVDIAYISDRLKSVLGECGYAMKIIRLSTFLHTEYAGWKGTGATELDAYIDEHQTGGNDLREDMKRKDALGLVALADISVARKEGGGANLRTAYLIRQLKTPEEVELLRSVYSERFVLLGVSAPRDKRIKSLPRAIAKDRDGTENVYTKYEESAKRLIDTDDNEGKEYGQNVAATFPLADFFADLEDPASEQHRPEAERFETQLRRFVFLLLGKADVPPFDEEFLMFQAQSVSYQSADRSRQVGAVVANLEGSVIAVGRNDDPKVGGGVAGSVSIREDEDPANDIKVETVVEIVDRFSSVLKPDFVELSPKQKRMKAMEMLRGTRLLGMGEFGRMVHAEMAALADAALRGVAVGGQVMFCTTFPCQNCAKHLMAAGIRALVFIAPYPKSLVNVMYEAEYMQRPMLRLKSPELVKLLEAEKPQFLIFSYLGVAPRRYMQFFAMPVRKTADGRKVAWNPKAALPRIGPALYGSEYMRWEEEFGSLLDPFRKKQSGVSPQGGANS